MSGQYGRGAGDTHIPNCAADCRTPVAVVNHRPRIPMPRPVVALVLRASVSISIAAHAQQPHVLVFSKTPGFRHSSIPNGLAAVTQLGQESGFAVDATEDAG